MDIRTHDLALTYAKSKLDYALQNNLIPKETCPKNHSEIEYLLDEYCNAYTAIQNVSIEERINSSS